MIRAIIFDMNGVIIDDEKNHEQAFREVLADFGYELTHDLYVQNFLGRSDLAGFKQVARTIDLPQPLEKLQEEKMQRYWTIIQNGIPLVHGIGATLERLAPHYTLALATGATREEMNTVFRQHHFGKYFSATITTEDISRSKPHPEAYVLTAQKLHLPPADCLVIEDAAAGVLAAQRAGMHCIGLTTSLSAEQLAAADTVIDSLNKLTPQLISRIEG